MADKPIWTVEQIVAQLTNWGDAWPSGQPVAYSFYQVPPSHLGSPPGFSTFSAAQRESVARSLELISDVAGISFVNLPDNGLAPGAGNERVSLYNINYSNAPFWGALTELWTVEDPNGVDAIFGGELVVNQHRAAVQGEWGLGDSNSRKLMHELLHGLGLDHPGPYNGDNANYESQALFRQDSLQYTVMSYWRADVTGADHEADGALRTTTTPLLYDVAALQALYGANMSTRTGDTIYGFNANAGRAALDLVATPYAIFTIWDAGGRDRLDLSGFGEGSKIDLNPGGFSSGGGMTDRISIAYGAVIEEAVAGAGDDLVIGSEGENWLFLQLGGKDEVRAGAGNDGIYFGNQYDGLDRVDGGDGVDTLALQGQYPGLTLGEVAGIEVISVLPGNDTRFGLTVPDPLQYVLASADANLAAGAVLTIIASTLRFGESLTFDGSAENDGHLRIFAGRGVDSLKGGAGNDGFFFGADRNIDGTDRVDGGGGTDSIALRGDHEGANAFAFAADSFANVEVVVLLSGLTKEYGGFIIADGFDYDLTMADGNVGAGQRLDVVAGTLAAIESVRFDGRAESDGAYRIISGAGDDILFGGGGADTLYGARGADRLDGGSGADSFIYRGAVESSGAGFDAIVGFDAASDRIDLVDEVGGLAAVIAGALSGASFDADLSAAASGLGAGQALLLAADAGDLAGRSFLLVDSNGTAGYQAGADYVIELVAPAVPIVAGADFFV